MNSTTILKLNGQTPVYLVCGAVNGEAGYVYSMSEDAILKMLCGAHLEAYDFASINGDNIAANPYNMLCDTEVEKGLDALADMETASHGGVFTSPEYLKSFRYLVYLARNYPDL